MFYLDGGNIYIHRGNTASFELVFGNVAPEELADNQISVAELYGIDLTPEDGTRARFSVKVSTDKYRSIIQKDCKVMNGVCSVDISPNDTKYLPFQTYKWDVRLFIDNDEYVDELTPFTPCQFHLLETVTESD